MTLPRIIAIIQARMGSKRLPGKVLLEVAGQPMLARVVERTRLARTLDKVVVATTSEPDDDPIARFCDEHEYASFRGSMFDVLDRYYQTAKCHAAEIIVRITADCPLIDPGVIDKTVNTFLGITNVNPQHRTSEKSESLSPPEDSPLATRYDFAANRLPPPWGRTYPIGLDTEVCTFQALEIAWKEAHQTHQREHVMPYFYDNQDRFNILLVNHDQDYGTLRWVVDTREDLELVRKIFAHFPERIDFSWLEVLEIFQREPELAQINAQVRHKTYDEVDERH